MTSSPPVPVRVREPVIFIRINQEFREGMSAAGLYEVTRGVWVIGSRRNHAKFAFAVYRGVVRGVYKIESWHRAGTTRYTTRSREDVRSDRRWEFIGRPATDGIRSRYLGRSVASYFQRGDANPIRYINC